MLLLSFVSKGQTVMASVTPKWCIAPSSSDIVEVVIAAPCWVDTNKEELSQFKAKGRI